MKQSVLTNSLDKNLPRYIWLFILLHFFCWTLAPIIVRYNLPLDAIEGTIWGHQLQLGYDKNPFLNGWLTSLATFIDGYTGWMIYALSQLSVVTCFWVVWHIGREFLLPMQAALAVLLLEGIQYFNFHAIDFNDNTLELGLWALTIYGFYFAMKTNSIARWCFTGAIAAAALMAKYFTLALLMTLALYLLLNRKERQLLKTLPPYFGLLVFLVLITPHVIWLYTHDFITVKYVVARASNIPHWYNHIFYPLQFAWQQLEVLLPSLIIFLILFFTTKHQKLNINFVAYPHTFLWCIGLGPLILTVILSFFLGITLRAGWGMPLLTFTPLLLIALKPPKISSKNFYCFYWLSIAFLFSLIIAYSYALRFSNTTTSANFPGKKIAVDLTDEWRQTFGQPLTYVAGSRWIGGNISFYSADHPSVFVEWDTKKAPWINIEDLKRHGALFVWDITQKEVLPPAIVKEFPELSKPRTIIYNWCRNSDQLEPIKIGIAILPPKQI